jgi:hypothetical protein
MLPAGGTAFGRSTMMEPDCPLAPVIAHVLVIVARKNQLRRKPEMVVCSACPEYTAALRRAGRDHHGLQMLFRM